MLFTHIYSLLVIHENILNLLFKLHVLIFVFNIQNSNIYCNKTVTVMNILTNISLPYEIFEQ